MSIGFVAVFLVLVLGASAFATWPIVKRLGGRARLVLGASLALFVVGVGAGSYLELGRPKLAFVNDRFAAEIAHVRAAPNDVRGWRILGRDYLDANDGEDSIRALVRAVQVARATGKENAGVYSDYGMAVAQTAGGVTPEAETAFRFALTLDPKDKLALFFLGDLAAQRGQNAQAAELWQTLLDELPAKSQFRQTMVDRIAALKAASGAAPDIGAMVAMLAARLKSDPDDPAGWQRLVRAYAVLNDRPKAVAALADARKALAKEPDALNALAAEAKELGLEK